jgi:hypothetical protein
MFEGARTSRLTADWVTSASSVDAEIRSSLYALRNRARQLCRDSDYAKQALRAIASNVIGQGISFQAQVKDQSGSRLNTAVNDQIEQLWSKWSRAKCCHTAGKLGFSDIERLLIRSVAESGEVLVRIVKQPFADSPVPLALEVLEADLLDDRYNGKVAETGNEVRMGIELDKWHRPVAYYFLPRHPGDYTFSNSTPDNYLPRTRVPADEVIHLFLTERPGQTRGISWFASAIKRLHHLSGYEEAEVIRARASSALMGFITSPEGELQGDEVLDGERVSSFEPGVFKYLAPGESVSVPQLDAPDGQFEPFMRSMLRAVSAGLGLAYENVSHDYSQSNYSSSRLSLLDERENWRVLQEWMIKNFHQQVFDVWLDMAVLNGALNLPLYDSDPDRYRKVKWQPRGWGWVDPEREVNALKEAVRCGFKTLSDVIAEQGGDVDEQLIAMKHERQTAEDLGLILDIDAGKVSNAGLTQARPAGSIIPQDPFAPSDTSTEPAIPTAPAKQPPTAPAP